ncbi:3-hydroxyisobutyryl-coenzyme A hydrolase, putative [Plasmodium malariae]|uniref:3-hydroxyisobutyryl-CoA hydrolase n=1 Tax=Plasmodium malariae TaxID=5858 RepID=A0A1C3L3G0_PLAMA|nr:3-hydroxyisobutyryl-coenzyme A hydrolase, putative [Plasmodium malariae]
MPKISSPHLHMNESKLGKVLFDYMTKFERSNFLFFRTYFFLINNKSNQQKKNSNFIFYEKKYIGISDKVNNFCTDGQRNKENLFEKMEKNKNNNLYLIDNNILNDKTKYPNFSTYVKSECTTDRKNEKENINKEQKNDNEKRVENNFRDIIDLELSDVWSKKSLVVNFKNNIFEIILNRPEKLNAINKDMINGLLNIIKNLNNDKRCYMIVIRSTNTNCFSSGSDVKDIVQNKEKGIQHLKQLYMYINYLSTMKKSVLCIWNGFVMGGGLGISMYAKYRVINKNAIFAMPECKIGFFPDIGCCYFFKKYFGRNIGLYLGLTSLRLNELDLVNFKICNNYVEDVDLFLTEIYSIKKENQSDFDAELSNILNKYPTKIGRTASTPVLTEDLISNINKYYSSANSLEDLIDNLKKGLKGEHNNSSSSQFCQKVLSDISANCYFSCKLWFSYFLYNYDKSLEEVLDNDFKLSQYFLFHTKTFEKGVTELLVKKNKNFQWKTDPENERTQLEENIEHILKDSSMLSIKEEFIQNINCTGDNEIN